MVNGLWLIENGNYPIVMLSEVETSLHYNIMRFFECAQNDMEYLPFSVIQLFTTHNCLIENFDLLLQDI